MRSPPEHAALAHLTLLTSGLTVSCDFVSGLTPMINSQRSTLSDQLSKDAAAVVGAGTDLLLVMLGNLLLKGSGSLSLY
jgi:hypothetical protein